MPHSPINLILGPARSGKTERALRHYCEALEKWQCEPSGPPHVWIGPTPAALGDVRDRLAERAIGGWLNPRMVTFATLAQEIVSHGSRRVRPICSLEKQRILSHVVERLVAEKQLKHFATVAGTPGFLRQVGAAIADLKRRDVWADDVRKRSHTPRDHDFSLIYLTYQEHLQQRQLYDAEGRFWAAREELQSLKRAGPNGASAGSMRGGLSYGLVVLDGFADFTAAQLDLLRLLAERCRELLITLPADGEPDTRLLLFDKPRRTLTQLEKSFSEIHRDVTNGAHFQSPALEMIERTIFRDDAVNPAPQPTAEGDFGGVAIIAANGVQGEIREVARRVKDLVRSGHARPEEVAVVFPSVEKLASRIVEVFDDFGLPLALESRTHLRATPQVRSIGTLLQLVVDDWPFDLLLEAVGNRAIRFAEATDRAVVEKCIRHAQLPAGRVLLLEQLRAWAESATEDSAPNISPETFKLAQNARAALGALSELDGLLSTLASPATLPQWCHRLETLQNQTTSASPEDAVLRQLLKKQLSLIHKIDQDFDAGERQLAPGELLELLERVADESLLPRSNDDIGRVRVMSAEQARNLSIKHLFLAGLSEQSYSSAESSSSLYSAAEMRRFDDAGAAANLGEQQIGEAMLLFYDMVTRASDSLTLSYPALDDKGQTLTPSPYLIELERCFAPGSIPTTVIPAGEHADTETLPASRSDWRTQSMLAAIDGKYQWLAGLVGGTATRRLGKALLRGVECVASRSRRDVFGPYEGLLLGETVRAALSTRFGAEHLWSPSQLETYATCPYQFFAKQILGLEPLDDIALRSDHLRKGHLLHQVLAAIHSQTPELGSTPDADQLIQRFLSALEQFIQRTPLSGLDDALREIERREITAWAPLYSQQELDYRQRWAQFDEPLAPAYFEVRFGPKSRSSDATSDAVSVAVPFVLDLGTEQIKLTGQIDRVDMGRVAGVTVFNIIDYKSGKKVKLGDAEITAGRQLQLPLYALAAEQLLFADRRAVALATGYWSIQAGGFASGRDALLEFRSHGEAGLTDSARWSELNASMKRRIAEIVRGVRGAHFPVSSEIPDCTRYCDYSKICRIAQIRSLEKVWVDIEDARPDNS